MSDEHKQARLVISARDGGARVDELVIRLARCSRSEARELCAAGAVRLDGRRVSKGQRVSAGAELVIELPTQGVLPDASVPLDVRLETADWVVVSKPAGIASAPLALGEKGTLANALLARYPEMAGVGYTAREPGLVHRLDTETSGLLVAARNQPAFERLQSALRAGALAKRYLAVVPQLNLPDAGHIALDLKPDPSRRGRVAVSNDLGEYSRATVSTYTVQERGALYALVEVAASPAFRHQVRAHLAAIGNPIVGDALYGGAADPRLGSRHALHANYVAWAGDAMPSFEVSDPAPPVFLTLVREAGSDS